MMTLACIVSRDCNFLVDLDLSELSKEEQMQIELCDIRNSAPYCQVLSYHTRCTYPQDTNHLSWNWLIDYSCGTRLIKTFVCLQTFWPTVTPVWSASCCQPRLGLWHHSKARIEGRSNRNRYNLEYLFWQTLSLTSRTSSELKGNATDTQSMQIEW